MSQFGFINPEILAWCLALPLLAAALIYLERGRLRKLRLWGQSRNFQISAVLLPCLMAIAAIIALARPYTGFQEVEVQRPGTDVMALVDVSKSMLAEDLKPNRMEFVRHKLLDLISLFAKTTGDRLGLILFAGDAYLFCPITGDYGVLNQFARSVSTGLIESGGSAIDTAVDVALRSFKETESEKPRLLLISDGEDLELDAAAVTAKLTAAGVKLDTLGVGTPEGRPIPVPGSGYLKDNQGNIVVTHLKEDILETLASGTGGKYARGTVDTSDLELLIKGYQSRRDSHATTITIYNEIGHWLIILALVPVILSVTLRRSSAIALLIFVLADQAPAYADSPKLSADQTAAAFERGDFASAMENFSRLHSENPNDFKLTQSLASSLFKLKKFPEAATLFDEAAGQAKNGREAFAARFGQGNAQLAANNYTEAINAYQQALEIKPKDAPTLFNLELARSLKKKQEEEQKQQQNQDQDKKQDQTSKDKQQQDSSKQNQQESKDEQDGQQPKPDQSTEKQDQGESEQRQDDSESNKPADDRQKRQPEGRTGEDEEDQDKQPMQNNTDRQETEPSQQQSPESEEQQPSQVPVQDQKKLSEQEAKAWLESLSDSPLLIRPLMISTRCSGPSNLASKSSPSVSVGRPRIEETSSIVTLKVI